MDTHGKFGAMMVNRAIQLDKQLKMGIKVEMEHTKDKVIARMIALDHLREYPDYYTRLKRCVETKNLKKVI